ncbi:flavin reductase family protein [Caproiciproducens sp. NJN-50]|uniref:flavin reductase family protein n=1 Tax=Acutalibacteraceae TaxID=3082771 RepID=UPI000FFE0D4E|nr:MULTISPECIES: flavin reductase family protein [Acutalibacteraceae]QAT48362.1 flavin reductase family protein [Caproiciproducens sp. NJN-50]
MAKKNIGAATAVSPIPAFMVTCANKAGEANIITISYGGIINANPPMVSISVRDSRYSYPMLKETGEFVVNIPGENLAKETDICGIRSARNVNKWELAQLTPQPSSIVKAPMIKECPVNMECIVRHVVALGSHDIFLAEVVATHIDEEILDDKDKVMIEKFKPFAFCYNSQEYWTLDKLIGHYGWANKYLQGK